VECSYSSTATLIFFFSDVCFIREWFHKTVDFLLIQLSIADRATGDASLVLGDVAGPGPGLL
jgi:hypothetical protein